MGRYLNSIVGTFATALVIRQSEHVVAGFATRKPSWLDRARWLLMHLGGLTAGKLTPARCPASSRPRATAIETSPRF
jgi:hypothetical protein